MGSVQLEVVRCPRISASPDPVPFWTWDDLLSELKSLELRLVGPPRKEMGNKPFVMCISDEDDDDDDEEARLMAGTRFSCTDLDPSDSEGSDDDEPLLEPTLMDKTSLEEGVLCAFESEHRQKVKEQLRIRLSGLQSNYQQDETEKSASAMFRIDKYTAARREMDRRLDERYQRKIAEELHSHLTAVRRDREHRCPNEQVRIRDDAAIQETKMKEKALQHQEKPKVEEGLTSSPRNMQLTGISVMAADAALKYAEANRLNIYDEAAEKYHVVARDLNRYERKIRICVGQIGGNLENVKAKATALMNIIHNPECPRSISILIFAKKMVSLCDNPAGNFDNVAFACGHVILLLTSQVPAVMHFVLAELNKSCIYTVPKHLQPSNPASHTKDYQKMAGYREEDGKLESSESYLNRVRSFMKLYAALVQTEIEGIRNPCGLREGWAWLAWFLNTLPPSRSSAVALEAFLKMAGFALNRRYGPQFRKVLNVISSRFLPALKEQDPDAGEIIATFEKYFDLKRYEEEPEGWRLQETLLSDKYRA